MTTQTHITRETVPENRRMAIAEKLFRDQFPMYLEPAIYSFADKHSEHSICLQLIDLKICNDEDQVLSESDARHSQGNSDYRVEA